MGLKIERPFVRDRLEVGPDAGAMHKYSPGRIADARARDAHRVALDLQTEAARLEPEHRRDARRHRRGRRIRRSFWAVATVLVLVLAGLAGLLLAGVLGSTG